MSVPRRSAAVIAMLATAWLCRQAYAPIYGGYPGLASLTEQSDVIAAVTILEQVSEEDFGGSARYKIESNKVLKGTLPKEHIVASLRKLDIIPNSERQYSPPPKPPPMIHYFGPADRFDPFRQSSRWIVFLAKTKQDKDAAYENVNCAGSTFPLSPLRDIDALKVQSLPDTLILLFREYADYKRSELKELEKQVDAFIHDGDK